jgi:pimeloyl-ACP methyl ester carboxylesterase
MASPKLSTHGAASVSIASTAQSATSTALPRPLRSLKSIVPSVENSGVMSGKANRNASVVIEQTSVDGSPVSYSTGGQGPTLLLLHGWGLGHHAYRPALEHLVAAGYHVVAPALPGFGGTADLGSDRSFTGYSAWVRRFALTLGLRDAIVVGHSFGGGVAIRLGVDDPQLVSRLVLCNSVGAPWRRASGPNGTQLHAMSKRPMWSWGINIPSDMIALLSKATEAMPSILEDLVPNVVRHPLTITRVGHLARNADLGAELNELRRVGFPMTVVHSERDGVIPRTGFECLREAAGVTGHLLPGNHSWPLTDPAALVAVVNATPNRIRAAA